MQLILAKLTVSPQFIKLLLGIAGVLSVTFILTVVLPWLRDFCYELRFLNMEIQRNTGREQEYWIKQRRRLWLSILPFFRYP